jgi:microcystin-dependent protein
MHKFTLPASSTIQIAIGGSMTMHKFTLPASSTIQIDGGGNTIVFTAFSATPGLDGASAYQVAVANGFVGTQSEWLEYLQAKGIIGEIRDYTGASIPSGWMVCERQLLAIADYPLLYAQIGAAYGGDGITNFALPNYRRVGSAGKKIINVDLHMPQPVLQVTVPAAIHCQASGYCKAGAVLAFSVQLLDDVVITGGPVSLVIDIGGSSHTLAFISGTSREWLFADYTVQSGDNGELTADISLNGAALVNGGIAAVLSASSLINITVDTTVPAAPTVNALSTSNQTPTVTGTSTVGYGEVLAVVVNGVTYTSGDGNLMLSGTSWSLVIPVANALVAGTYNVVATLTDAAGNATSDSTANELVITA